MLTLLMSLSGFYRKKRQILNLVDVVGAARAEDFVGLHGPAGSHQCVEAQPEFREELFQGIVPVDVFLSIRQRNHFTIVARAHV